MELDVILFVLRVTSALILVGFLLALFVIMWRDYRSTVDQTLTRRRVYGRLLELTKIDDGTYADAGVVHPLHPITSIGRAPTNTIVIPEQYASSEHALIALRSGQWWLEDRNSRNGTYLNGEPITAPIIITEGDIISIGESAYRLVLQA